MKLFTSIAHFSEVCGGVPKWDRSVAALGNAAAVSAQVTYSIGDSLTYRRTVGRDLHSTDFLGRRRYHLLLSPIAEPIEVEVARQQDLTVRSAYDDLTDRQWFSGAGRTAAVPAGAVAVFDITDAARINSLSTSDVMVLHVTVEGATFHNK